MFESFNPAPRQEKAAADILKGSSLENIGLEPIPETPKKVFESFNGEYNPYAKPEVKTSEKPAAFQEDAAGRPILTDTDARRAEEWLKSRGSDADNLTLQ